MKRDSKKHDSNISWFNEARKNFRKFELSFAWFIDPNKYDEAGVEISGGRYLHRLRFLESETVLKSFKQLNVFAVIFQKDPEYQRRAKE